MKFSFCDNRKRRCQMKNRFHEGTRWKYLSISQKERIQLSETRIRQKAIRYFLFTGGLNTVVTKRFYF